MQDLKQFALAMYFIKNGQGVYFQVTGLYFVVLYGDDLI